MPASKELFLKNPNPVFIETGSCIGDGVQLAIDTSFQSIFSIELSDSLYKHCINRFKDIPNVFIIHGDSGSVLGELLSIINKPVTFWLDAHHGDLASPLLKELEIIGSHHIKTHTLMIDDLRDWNIPKHGFNVEVLKQKISLINSNYCFIFEDGIVPHDILVAKILL